MLRALALLAAVSAASAARVQPCSWTRYNQYDSPWASEMLAGGSSTIKSKGCAVTSVAMALASKGFRINSATANPSNLNRWLMSNGGFVGNAIVWGSVGKLGMSNVLYGSPTLEQMRSYVRSCSPMVANVRSGGHWVLITGYDDANSNFYVNDPGYSDTFYPFSGISRVAVYSSNRAMMFGVQDVTADGLEFAPPYAPGAVVFPLPRSPVVRVVSPDAEVPLQPNRCLHECLAQSFSPRLCFEQCRRIRAPVPAPSPMSFALDTWAGCGAGKEWTGTRCASKWNQA